MPSWRQAKRARGASVKTLSSVIDRRASKGKSTENRRKFLERVRESVKEAMPSILNGGSLKDIAKDGGKVAVKKKSVQEPSFRFGKGGQNEHILPGNKEFIVGDKLKKPQGGSGGGGQQGADSGDGEDPFVVQISRDEFLNFLFEDLELPELVKKDLSEITETRQRNAGYSTTGTPARLAVKRSMKMAHMRRLGMRGAALAELEEGMSEEELEAFWRRREELRGAAPEGGEEDERSGAMGLGLSDEQAQRLMERSARVPFLDTMDLRFRSVVKEEKAITSATMVCIMDNSGSMGEREKTLSRKFFYLLYLFLNRKYERIELIFIHHTDKAREVSEEEFFSTRESGGTVVSSALLELRKMMPGRLDPAKTNVYVCQCSDGDNYTSDNALCQKLLKEELLGATQYWAYIQIDREGSWPVPPEGSDTLWSAYGEVGESMKNLARRRVGSEKDIYPVFRNLFEKRQSSGGSST